MIPYTDPLLEVREKVGVCVWERERERDTQTERQPERQTDRDRQRERDRQTDRQRQRESESERDREIDREREREREIVNVSKNGPYTLISLTVLVCSAGLERLHWTAADQYQEVSGGHRSCEGGLYHVHEEERDRP